MDKQAFMLAEAECHSMLQTAASPFVRDRLHGMLDELLQVVPCCLSNPVHRLSKPAPRSCTPPVLVTIVQ